MGMSTGQTTAEGLLQMHLVSGNVTDICLTRGSSAPTGFSKVYDNAGIVQSSCDAVHCGMQVPSAGQAWPWLN